MRIQGKRILIVGATSAIGFAVCGPLVDRGAELFLLGRDSDKLERNARELEARSGRATGRATFEARDTGSHPKLWARARQHLGGLDGVLVAHGVLPEQSTAQSDFEMQREATEINFLGNITFLTLAADELESGGLIAVVSSPAGDRGRKKNYIYGATKAALSSYTDGLRQRLHGRGVRVLNIKPGWVRSPMTEGMKVPTLAEPEQVADDIIRAIERDRDEVYTPWFWRYVMALVKAIPESLFKRMSF